MNRKYGVLSFTFNSLSHNVDVETKVLTQYLMTGTSFVDFIDVLKRSAGRMWRQHPLNKHCLSLSCTNLNQSLSFHRPGIIFLHGLFISFIKWRAIYCTHHTDRIFLYFVLSHFKRRFFPPGYAKLVCV